MRLVDLLDLDQEEAAFYMGVCRKAFWNDLMNARKKIATALVYGTGLRIEGGSFILRGGEGTDDVADRARHQEMELMERELALLRSRLEHLGLKMDALKGPAKKVDSPPKGDSRRSKDYNEFFRFLYLFLFSSTLRFTICKIKIIYMIS